MFSSFLEWLPLWGQLVVLAVGFVFILAFMMMPFAVFGVKGRITELSIQIEELQEMIRIAVSQVQNQESQNQERGRRQQSKQSEETVSREVPFQNVTQRSVSEKNVSRRNVSQKITVEEIQTVKQPYTPSQINSLTRDNLTRNTQTPDPQTAQTYTQIAYPQTGQPVKSIEREDHPTFKQDQSGLDSREQELPTVLPDLHALRVSDAYEARQVEMPPPIKSPLNEDVSSHRLPWHEGLPKHLGDQRIKSQETQETEEEMFIGQNPPDINLPPYKPDFSSGYHANPRLRPNVKRYPVDRQDLNLGRTEPVLTWPRRS